MSSSALITRVLIASAVLGGASAAVMGWYFGAMSAASSVAGSVLAAANFALLARLATTLLDDTNPSRGRAGVLLGVKFIGLVTVVGVLVVNNYVRGGAFMAGVSAVVAAITLVGLFNSTSPDTTDPPGGGEPR